jgi:hypothetical protein
MDPQDADRWRAHIAGCASCGRYDRVLRRGLRTLAAQPHVDLDADFTSELHRRLASEDRRFGTRPITSMAAASVAVAAMLAFAAWLPVLLLTNGPEPVIAAPATPAASEIAWHGEGAVEYRAPSHVHQARRVVVWPTHHAHVIEPKYTPVVLESPIAPLNYAQTVSAVSE